MKIHRIGIDLGKTSFHLAGLSERGEVVVRKRFSRAQLLRFTANRKVHVIGMEACGGAHYLGRALQEQGHAVRLIPAQYVKPYVKTNKNDYVDAEAIAEAVGRPTMRFVPIKSDDQLDLQSLHRVRERWEQRMATGHIGMLAPIVKHGIPLPTLARAGALRSSANDMLTFLEAFLGYKESPLAAAMKAMLEVRRPVGKIEIGLGWFINSFDGREIALHNGGTTGFCSFAGYDPEERIGVVVLSNTLSNVDDIGFHLLNPKAPLRKPEPPKQRTEVPIDPKLLDNYTGRYQLAPDRILEITRDGDRLFAQGSAQVNGQTIAGPKFEVFAESEKNFFVKATGSEITFETGLEGRATSLIMHRAGREPMPAPRLS